jgi:hypothetical protein
MAGVVARLSPATELCQNCYRLTLAPIVLGIWMWLLATFAFAWIKQRNILFLLIYGSFLVLIALAILCVIIAAFTFDIVSHTPSADSDFVHTWEYRVEEWPEYICSLQSKYNCSGYYFGCCKGYNASLHSVGPYCYGENGTIPSWVKKICSPHCANTQAQMCTDVISTTMKKNFGGFLVILFTSMVIIINGLVFVLLVRNR